MIQLPQIITDMRAAGIYDAVAMPDGSLHPGDERALLAGCWYDVEAAERVIEYFATLLVIPWEKGDTLNDWERYWINRCASFDCDRWQPLKPFVLLQWWYKKVLSKLFGWRREDGRRRFQKAFVTTAKKSGKSSTLSGLPLYMMTADGEMDAETYAAATTRDQAGIIYKKVLDMTKRSPHIGNRLHPVPSKKRVVHEASGSLFEAISSDVDSSEGKNPHLLIVDELHAWRNRAFFEALMYGDIQRSQPLFLMITTAGDDPESVGKEEYDFAAALIDPDNDFWSTDHFAYIAEFDRDPDTQRKVKREWDDPAGWLAANPSIAEGVGSIEKLQSKCEEAKQSPRKQRAFLRYICNGWLDNSADAWLDARQWRSCGSVLPDHAGEPVWCGLDLSSVNDFTALAMAWRAGNDIIDLQVRLWMPAEGIREKSQQWKVPLQDWIDAGWIETTPGATVNYSFLRSAISGYVAPKIPRDKDAVTQQFDLRELAYDRYNGHKLVETELGGEDGIVIAEHGQGYLGMSPPAKEFEARVNDGRLRHDNNPVMDWMIRSTIVDEDPAGNIKPNKKKSKNKIDGVVAAVMAVERAALNQPKQQSVYSTRGVILI